jgi:hypothetical protein
MWIKKPLPKQKPPKKAAFVSAQRVAALRVNTTHTSTAGTPKVR